MAPLRWLPLLVLAPVAAGQEIMINLDVEPGERWKDTAKVYRSFFTPERVRFWEEGLPFDRKDLDELLEVTHFEEEHLEEMHGFLEMMKGTNLTMRGMKLMQMPYELGLTEGFDCSGIVAAMPDGTVVHGRNMDLEGNTSWHDAGGVTVNFQSKGKIIITGPGNLGSLGLHTGMRLHFTGGGFLDSAWSWQQNTRFEQRYHTRKEWMRRSIQAARLGGLPFSMVARKIFTEAPRFEEAVSAFAATPFIVPQYFVLAGQRPFQGAVITVGRQEGWRAFHDVRALSSFFGRWFLVQTNDDNWNAPLDSRRPEALRMLREAGQDAVNLENITQVMRTDPVCNAYTKFTWVAVPAHKSSKIITTPCEGAKSKRAAAGNASNASNASDAFVVKIGHLSS